MNSIKAIATIITLIALPSCVSTKSDNQNREVSERKLNSLEGEIITVKGFLRYGPHERQLWNSKTAYKKGDFLSECLTLYNTRGFEEILSFNSGQVIEVTGLFTNGYPNTIDLASCGKKGIEIASVRIS